VALRSDGLFVLSGRPYSREVMAAAAGTAAHDSAALLRGEIHRKLRRELGPAQVVVTLLPDAGLPLPGVQALGLALQVGREIVLRGRVYCASPEACHDARELVDATLTDLASEPGLAALRSASMQRHSGRLEVQARLSRQELAPLLRQLLTP
jgi:hypothetical protein